MNVFFFTLFKINLKQELKPNFVITLLLFEFLSQQSLCFFCFNFMVLQSKNRNVKQHSKIVVSFISYYPMCSQKAHRLTKEKSNLRIAALCAISSFFKSCLLVSLIMLRTTTARILKKSILTSKKALAVCF